MATAIDLGCACERADPPRGACFPAEQGLEHTLWFSSARTSADSPATETENPLFPAENPFGVHVITSSH